MCPSGCIKGSAARVWSGSVAWSRNPARTVLGGHAQPCGLCLAQRGQPGPARPAGGKYRPLREHLSGTAGTRVRLTFAEVEDLVGRLPESAYRHRAWWGNNDGNVEARA